MTNISTRKILYFLLTIVCLCALTVAVCFNQTPVVHAAEVDHGVNTPIAWSLSSFGSTENVEITNDVDDVDAFGGKVAHKVVISSSSQTTGVKITFEQAIDLTDYAHVFVRWKNFNSTEMSDAALRVGVDDLPVAGSQTYPFQSANSALTQSMLYYKNFFSYDIKDMVDSSVTSVTNLYIGVVDGVISNGDIELYIDHVDFLEEGLSLTNLSGLTNDGTSRTYDASSSDAYSNAKILQTNNLNSLSAWQGWDLDIHSGSYALVGQFGVNAQTGKESERALTLNFDNIDMSNYSNVIIKMKNYNSSKKPDGSNPYFSTNTTVTVKANGDKQDFTSSASGGIPFKDPNLNPLYANTTLEAIYSTWYEYDLITQSTNCPAILNEITLCRGNAVQGGLTDDRGILMLIESIEFVPILTQKVDTIKLGKQYSLNELVGLSNTVPATEDAVFIDGYLNADAPSGTLNELGRLSAGSIQVTGDNYDTVNKTYSICVYARNVDLKGKQTGYFVFTYNVDESLAISYNDLPLVVGVEMDLRSLFNIEGRPDSIEFKMDGQAVSSGLFTADQEQSHTLYCKVTNSGGTQEVTAQVKTVSLGLLEEISDEFQKGKKEYFAAPALPFENVSYTTKLYKQSDDVATATPLSIDSSYVFTQSGSYKLVYNIYIVDIDRTITFTTNYNVTLVEQQPTITVDGELQSEYYSGYLLTLPTVSASNDYQSYDVITKVNNGSDVAISNGTVKLSQAGNYTVTFTVTYDTDRSVTKTFNFVVIEDTQAPEIYIDGSYGESYEVGLELDVLSATVVDNSGVPITVEIEVLKGDQKIEPQNGKIVLEKGKYTITYTATDPAGHETVQTFNFNVGSGSAGDGLPGWAIVLICVGSAVIVGGAVVVIILIKKRGQKHD